MLKLNKEKGEKYDALMIKFEQRLQEVEKEEQQLKKIYEDKLQQLKR